MGKKRKKVKQRDEKEGEGMGNEAFIEEKEDRNEDETDISSFVKIFERRGFKLKEESVDKKNKMFVSMVFYKSGIPVAGKHKGSKWTGKEYQRVSKQDGRMKFLDNSKDDEEITVEEETKTLKPCVYKTR